MSDETQDQGQPNQPDQASQPTPVEPHERQDVTVRIPVQFESAAEAAGYIWGAVNAAMRGQYEGSPYVIFRDRDREFIGFTDGGAIDPYEGVLPHGLVERNPPRFEKLLRQLVFDIVMGFYNMDDSDTDDQLWASEETDKWIDHWKTISKESNDG